MKRIVVAVGVLALAAASAAYAAKPGSGSDSGRALVFTPNPVQDLGIQTLTDQKDSADVVPQEAYRPVKLTDLDGSGYLRGKWAVIRSETGNPAYSPTNAFLYDRHQDEFEQVMAYYWITQAQRYVQSLGFGSSLRPVNMRPQKLRINQWGVDNSFATDKQDEIRLGKGGVDDAEDGEVILHEYGHAIQGDQVPGFGPGADSGAIGEAFGDYFAVSFGNAISGNTFEPGCVMDWDSTFYTSQAPHCLRRTDLDLHYPEDLRHPREVHADGRIWSRALWDINQHLGDNERADRIIIGAQFGFSVDPSFAEAALTTVAYAKAHDPAAAQVVCDAFVDRGFIDEDDCGL